MHFSWSLLSAWRQVLLRNYWQQGWARGYCRGFRHAELRRQKLMASWKIWGSLLLGTWSRKAIEWLVMEKNRNKNKKTPNERYWRIYFPYGRAEHFVIPYTPPPNIRSQDLARHIITGQKKNSMQVFFFPSFSPPLQPKLIPWNTTRFSPLQPSLCGNSCLTFFQASIRAEYYDFEYDSSPEPLASVKITLDLGWSRKTRHEAPHCCSVG